MYKKQMTLQRIACYLLLAAAALVFFYSLGLLTDIYESNFAFLAQDIKHPMAEGTEIYYNMQEFNRSFTAAGIVLILLAVSLFVTQTHNRRKYYVANYITVGACAVANVAVTVWALIKVFSYRAQFLLVDFDAVEEYANIFKFEYTTSTFWFDAAIPVFAILLLATALSVFNAIFKMKLMREEARLLNMGREECENA